MLRNEPCANRRVCALKHLLESGISGNYPAVGPGHSASLGGALHGAGDARREAAAFADQAAAATSPVGQALLASERFAMHRDVQKALGELERLYEERLQAVRNLDAAWDAQADA